MVTPVKINAKVVVDNTGVECELPILITEEGPVEPLVDYLLLHRHNRSHPWSNRVVHATYLFIQYIDANRDFFSKPQLLFQSFSQCLYVGSISNDGIDPSGLYWLGWSTKTANYLINSLTGLLDFIADRQGIQNINPIREATPYEQSLNYAAWFRRNQHDFLGHIKNTGRMGTVNKARNIQRRRSMVNINDDSIAFSESLFRKFYYEGVGGAKDIRVATRNQLILLLMHFAGCRESDALHLWIHDVFYDSNNPEIAIIQLYHPEEGKAPDGWRGLNGCTHRAAYLREKYALTPRNRLTGTQHVGWKNVVVDNMDNYIRLHWFPQQAGVLFAQLWHNYIRYLLSIERNHPYAFVSFAKKTSGKPLTIKAFEDAYQKSVYRIGETPSKKNGLSTHSHRHAMGRRLEKSGVSPHIIKKVLHHKSLTSQLPYTTPGIERVTKALTQCYSKLEQAKEQDTTVLLPDIDWNEITEYGYEDIDPNGLMTGLEPQLNGRI
jgi:hypothetical protein